MILWYVIDLQSCSVMYMTILVALCRELQIMRIVMLCNALYNIIVSVMESL